MDKHRIDPEIAQLLQITADSRLRVCGGQQTLRGEIRDPRGREPVCGDMYLRGDLRILLRRGRGAGGQRQQKQNQQQKTDMRHVPGSFPFGYLHYTGKAVRNLSG